MCSPAAHSTNGKERHDRVLYLPVRAVLRARGLPIPGGYQPRGGQAKPGVLGTDVVVVQVDQNCPTDRIVANSRPDMVVRLEAERRLVTLEVAWAWEPAIATRETEKKLCYQNLAADLARQNPGY